MPDHAIVPGDVPFPFCANCGAWFPVGTMCPDGCGAGRAAWLCPAAPNEPLYRVLAPGRPALELATTDLDGRRCLIVPWTRLACAGRSLQEDGGVLVLDARTGAQCWSATLEMPVESGVVVLDERVVVACGERGIVDAGRGQAKVLDLRAQEVRDIGPPIDGTVRAAPAVDDVRVYVASGSGSLHCLDRDLGVSVRPWPVTVTPQPRPILAAPVIVRFAHRSPLILVGTFDHMFLREPGLVVAFDDRGVRAWSADAQGQVHARLVVGDELVFVAASQRMPQRGVLSALDVRTGRSAWARPFVVEPDPRWPDCGAGIAAAPLLRDGVLYFGSANGRLYAVNAATGEGVWDLDLAALRTSSAAAARETVESAADDRPPAPGIATTPAWVEGLLVFGADDGYVYAVDADDLSLLWDYGVGARIRTSPLVCDGSLYVGAEDGSVVALPWHLGRYASTALHLVESGRLATAGDHYALAAQHDDVAADTKQLYRERAVECWRRADEFARAASLWQGVFDDERAAIAWCDAGHAYAGSAPHVAARCFSRAAELFFQQRKWEELNACTERLARAARLPWMRIEVINVGTLRQWQVGELTLRLLNCSKRAVLPPGLKIWVGGRLAAAVEALIQTSLAPGGEWKIPLKITPTEDKSELVIEIEYDTGSPEFRLPMRTIARTAIEAGPAPATPLQVEQAGTIVVNIDAEAAKALQNIDIVTGSAGLIKAAVIRQVHAAQDVGAVISHGDIGASEAGGTTVVRSARRRKPRGD